MAEVKKDFSINHMDLLNKALTEKGYISKCYRCFHNFSINNQWIASWQLMAKGYDLSPIATFNKWKSLGRSVNKGEKALYLWMPIGGSSFTVKDEETGEEKTYTGTILNSLYDDIAEDIEVSADVEFNDDDIRLAIGRVLIDRLELN